MAHWEYRTLRTGNSESSETIQRDLDLLGQQGWELVSVVRFTRFNDWGGADIRYFFKREKD